jgi:hypothetical protein
MDTDDGLLKAVIARLPKQGDDDFHERIDEIARGADVSPHTLLKIAKGETTDPRVSTVESLIRYFQQQGAPA